MIRQDVVLEPLPEERDWRARTQEIGDAFQHAVVRARHRRVWASPVIIAGIGFTGFTVYLTGGTSRGFTLLFLLPTLAGAYFYGASGGALTGLAGATVAAILPFGGHGRQFADTQGLRFVVFVLVGFITGTFVSAFARELEGHTRLLTEATRTLWRALEVRDHDQAAHAERVSAYAQAIAHELRLPAEQIDRIGHGALLHNIGHIAVPDGSSMTPLVSERVLRESRELEPLVSIVRSHHERWDGSGYPDRLHSHETPLEARIVKVANVYDNLTHSDGDHPADTPIEALSRIRSEAGSRFDPGVVAALERLFGRWHVTLPPDFLLDETLPRVRPPSRRDRLARSARVDAT